MSLLGWQSFPQKISRGTRGRNSRKPASPSARSHRPARPKKRWIAALAAAALLLAVPLIWWSLPKDDESTTPAVAPSDDAREFDDQLAFEIRVQKDEQATLLRLRDAIPLRIDDQVQIYARPAPDAHVVLYSLGTTGDLNQLVKFQREEKPTADEIYFPSAETTIGLKGEPGTELVLLCGRASKPIEAAEVEDCFDGEPWPAMLDWAMIEITHDRVRQVYNDRDQSSHLAPRDVASSRGARRLLYGVTPATLLLRNLVQPSLLCYTQVGPAVMPPDGPSFPDGPSLPGDPFMPGGPHDPASVPPIPDISDPDRLDPPPIHVISDDALQQAEALRVKLAERFDVVLGVAFPHVAR